MKNVKVLFQKVNKRTKFIVVSVLITLALFGRVFLTEPYDSISLLFGASTVLLGTFFAQDVYRNVDIIPTYLMPVFLYSGAVLSLNYFPNLGIPTKILTITGVGVVYYLLSLVNNIFIVVESSEKRIPLYRVAVTWSQILLIIISIPYFAGLFKIPIDPISQNLISAVSASLFSLYLLWALSFDEQIKNYGISEALSKSFLVAFVVFCCGVAVSFFPTESFLRAIFVSSAMMSALGFIQSHYKNSITGRLVYEYSFITLLFLIILIVFTP